MKNLQQQIIFGANILLHPCVNRQKRNRPTEKVNEYPLTKNRFIQKVRLAIEENINDDTFGIPQLCYTILISRSQLHNKIKAATGVSTSIYIRSIRIEKAKELLENTDLNVSEVAYQVGYKDPSYFSRLYSEAYNISPSKVRKRLVVSYRRNVSMPLVGLT